MRQQDLLNEARSLLAHFVTLIKGSAAMGHTDINVISEGFLLGLLREAFNLPALRNLNLEKKNFPGLDLADDDAGVGYQITATPDLAKVKDTLETIVTAGLQAKYRNIRIYVLTEKQASYSQASIDAVTKGRLTFDSKTDIQDFRDVLRACAGLDLSRLERVVALLREQLSPSPAAATRPSSGVNLLYGAERVDLNLVPCWLPPTLYVADFIAPRAVASSMQKGASRRRSRRPANLRKIVAEDVRRRGFDVPEDFEVHGGRLVSFHDPTTTNSHLDLYVDPGTLTEISPKSYYRADDDQLNVFKSLLRRAFQRQMRPEGVRWQDMRHMFFYGPLERFEDRTISWKEERSANRTVFQKTMKTTKPDEILTCKHLAFYVDFHIIEDAWYIAITPSWYFSRDGYHPDAYGAKRVSWLKRQENDQQVHTHFRFICHRLRELQEASLFDIGASRVFIQIGEAVSFPNHPHIPDQLWKPPGKPAVEAAGSPEQKRLGL